MMKKTIFGLMVLLAAFVAALAVSCELEVVLSLSESEFAVDFKDSKITVTVNSNYPWTAVSSQGWITLAVDSGEAGSKVLIAEIDQNDTDAERSGTITVTCKDIRKTITVRQAKDVTVYSILSIEHSCLNWTIPSFSGSSVSGTVDWGDGGSNPYSAGLSHSYTSPKDYTVNFRLAGAESVEIPEMEGISYVDFSQF